MDIHLNEEDLRRMPKSLSVGLLSWLQAGHLRAIQSPISSSKQKTQQLALELRSSNKHPVPLTSVPSSPSKVELVHPQVRLSQLFEAGLTTVGMAVRVKLTSRLAQKCGYFYITEGVSISKAGTMIYLAEEFDKPSPLARRLNGSPINGWEYIEVKQDGAWVTLDTLRQKMKQKINER